VKKTRQNKERLTASRHPKGCSLDRGTSAVKTSIEAARVDRRIERPAFSREHPVRF
jgi:hypothetical protein